MFDYFIFVLHDGQSGSGKHQHDSQKANVCDLQTLANFLSSYFTPYTVFEVSVAERF